MGVTRFVRSQGWLWPALLALALAVPLAFAGCGGGEGENSGSGGVGVGGGGGGGDGDGGGGTETPAPVTERLCSKMIQECNRWTGSVSECVDEWDRFLLLQGSGFAEGWRKDVEACLTSEPKCPRFAPCLCAQISFQSLCR